VSTITCDHCGFDAARWSQSDVDRTLAHADDLHRHVTEGWAAAPALTATAHDDGLHAVHDLMHHLHSVAQQRRIEDPFEPMVGGIASLQSSKGGVPKTPLAVAELDASGIVGDRQRNRAHHGRPWQAVCVYSRDRLDELAAEGHPIVAGAAGENLTISDVDWSRMRGGLTIEVGAVTLRVSSPATPCHKIADCFADRAWDRIHHDLRPGWSRWYASVVTGGVITVGDTVTITG
jgi:hypothetical protein